MKIVLEYNLIYIRFIATILIVLLVMTRGILGRRIHRIQPGRQRSHGKSWAFHNCRNLKVVEAGKDTVFSIDAFLGAGGAQIKRYD